MGLDSHEVAQGKIRTRKYNTQKRIGKRTDNVMTLLGRGRVVPRREEQTQWERMGKNENAPAAFRSFLPFHLPKRAHFTSNFCFWFSTL